MDSVTHVLASPHVEGNLAVVRHFPLFLLELLYFLLGCFYLGVDGGGHFIFVLVVNKLGGGCLVEYAVVLILSVLF